MGLATVTTVGEANVIGSRYENIVCAQTGPRNLTEEEIEEAIKNGHEGFSSYEAWCKAKNVEYNLRFMKLDAEEFIALMNARLEKLDKDYEETKPKTMKKTASILAYYEHNPKDGKWEFTHDNHLSIDDASVQRYWKLPKEIKEAACQAYALRLKLDYLRERIRDYNRRLKEESSLQAQSPEPDRYDIEQAQAYVAWATNEVNRLEPLARNMLKKLRVDDQEQRAFDDIMKWLDPSYAVLRIMSEEGSLDKFYGLARRIENLEADIKKQTEQIRSNEEDLEDLQRYLKNVIKENLEYYRQNTPHQDPAPNQAPSNPIGLRERENETVIPRRPDWQPMENEEQRDNVYQVEVVEEVEEVKEVESETHEVEENNITVTDGRGMHNSPNPLTQLWNAIPSIPKFLWPLSGK